MFFLTGETLKVLIFIVVAKRMWSLEAGNGREKRNRGSGFQVLKYR